MYVCWDVMAHWLRRLLSTGWSWVRLPLWPSRRDLGQVLYLQLPVRFVSFIHSISLLYCIVLYLYIYIALLAEHTNQKRFQCERPREKRAVLRERKEALGSPVNKVDRVEGRSWFQSEGPMIAKARV